MIQLSDEYERKIMHSCKVKSQHSDIIIDFVKTISYLHFSINNQLNSNSVTLGTKTHRIAQNRVEILKERMIDCYHINKSYVKKAIDFNREENTFSEKC